VVGSGRKASIEVRDLVVRYGKVAAVRGVSFTVAAGEHLTLLGPSGCGKTTTLRAIAGLEQPESGEIRIDGSPVFASSPRVQVPPEKRGLSMVFQSYAIWPHMTVFDNVAYGLRVRKLPSAEIAERVRGALELVQMGELAARSASKLSGGQQQRVALARAFVFSPSVLLFDEPLSNLDAKLRAEMRLEIKELQRPPRHHLGLRHPRSRGGAGHLRPHRGHARRRDRAGWARPTRSTICLAILSSPTSSARPTSSAGATGRTSSATASWSWRRRAVTSSTAPPMAGG